MFSVIIPLYNKAATIDRAMRSVLGQTFPEFEIVVVDDGSTDDGAAVVRRYVAKDSRIRLIQQSNGGVSAARNTGIQDARYEYIVFLDADDEYLPDYLETMKRLINTYPQCGIWAVRYFLEANGKLVPAKINGLAGDFEGIIENYFEVASKSAPPICTGAACCSRANLLEIKGFPIGVRSGEDLLTWARICARHTLAYSMTPQVIYHLGACADFQPKRVPQADNYVGRALKELYSERPLPGLRQYIALWYKNRISCYLRLRMRWQAFRESCQAILISPFTLKLYAYLILSICPFFVVRWAFRLKTRFE